MDNTLKPEDVQKVGKSSGCLLHVLFIDGYEKYYDLIFQWESNESNLSVSYKAEQNFIYLNTPTGERYIPMCNIREFGITGQPNI